MDLFDKKQNVDLLSTRLAGLLGTTGVEYTSLPANVRARVRALKNLQVELNKTEVEYYKELHALEIKYSKLNQKVYEKRAEIVNGRYEPNGRETEFNEDYEESELNQDSDHSQRGIPKFWLTVFKNVEPLAAMIQPQDEEILSHLQDVRLTVNEKGFVLEFVFEKNDFFTNDVLSKTYELDFAVDESDPLDYSGPEIVSVKGTQINWTSEEKNPTITYGKKNKKQKNRSVVSQVSVVERAESFFNFFNPPTLPEGDAEVDDDLRLQVSEDYEAGDVLRQTVVHDAVLYFTGEALLSDDEDDEDEYMEDESDDSM